MKLKKLDKIATQTYHYDLRRAAAWGVVETAYVTFFLMIAVRWFSAGPTAKSLLSSGTMIGFLLSPVIVYLGEKFQIRINKVATFLSLGSAILLGIGTVFSNIWVFVTCGTLAPALTAAGVPLLTQIYQHNYPKLSRGRLFSHANSVKLAVSLFFAPLAGYALTGNLMYFQILLFVYTLCSLYITWCLTKFPSRRIKSHRRPGIFNGFAFLKSDMVFRNTIICWSLMGFGNLMMIPLRVEYLANHKYGLNLTEMQIAIFISTVPGIVRMFLSPVWGRMFDRLNFFWLRILVNLSFMAGILMFFLSDSLGGLIVGSIIYGIAGAGADIAWSLWVTKFAPTERVADYMSVHTFFTGVRGILAPLVSFHLIQFMSLSSVGLISAGLILLASLMLIPEAQSGDLKHREQETPDSPESPETM